MKKSLLMAGSLFLFSSAGSLGCGQVKQVSRLRGKINERNETLSRHRRNLKTLKKLSLDRGSYAKDFRKPSQQIALTLKSVGCALSRA